MVKNAWRRADDPAMLACAALRDGIIDFILHSGEGVHDGLDAVAAAFCDLALYAEDQKTLANQSDTAQHLRDLADLLESGAYRHKFDSEGTG